MKIRSRGVGGCVPCVPLNSPMVSTTAYPGPVHGQFTPIKTVAFLSQNVLLREKQRVTYHEDGVDEMDDYEGLFPTLHRLKK